MKKSNNKTYKRINIRRTKGKFIGGSNMNIIEKIRLLIEKRQAVKQYCNIIRLGSISNYDTNNLNKNKKTVGYISIKTNDDANVKEIEMKNMIKRYAKENNLEISTIYVDKIPSRKNLDKRYSLKKILQDAKKEEIGQVIVPMIEHISRDCIYTQKVVDTLNSKNVKLVCAVDGLILG